MLTARVSGRMVAATGRWSRDFRDLVEQVFPGDPRQLRDLRRSGTQEGFAGGARSEDMAQKTANSINRSNTLWRTYNPVDLVQAQRVDQARIEGRKRHRAADETQI
jgi:hypothetical protein